MKILMITPPTGGIDVYVSRLAQEMQRLGYEVDLLGCQRNEMAYDIDNKKWRTSQEAKSLVKRVIHQVDFASYDVVAFHYGKNDLEQYFPVALRGEGVKINKSVYFVHFLSWNLFSDYLGDEDSRVEVEEAVYSSFDQYLFFGEFARKFLTNKADHSLSGIVSYLPETHSHESVSESETREILAKYMSDESNNIETIFFPGFAANYKDHNLLLESLRYVDRPINLVFAGQGWSKRLGFDKKRINNVNTYVVDDYLTGKEYKVLSEKSLMGVFPFTKDLSISTINMSLVIGKRMLLKVVNIAVVCKPCLKEKLDTTKLK